MDKFTYEEVFKSTLEYFNGDYLATSTAINKYLLKDKEGSFLEKSPEDLHNRLAVEFARIEKKLNPNVNEAEYFQKIRKLLEKFRKIVPQGSPMAAIGNQYSIQSLSNCLVVSSPKAGATSGKSGAVPVATPMPSATLAEYYSGNAGTITTSPVAAAQSISPTTTTSVADNSAPVQTTTVMPAANSTGTVGAVSTSGSNDLSTGTLSGLVTAISQLQNAITTPTVTPSTATSSDNSYLTGQMYQAAYDYANAANAASAPGASTTTTAAANPTGIAGLLSGGATKWIIAAAIIGGGIYYYRRQQKGGTMKVGA